MKLLREDDEELSRDMEWAEQQMAQIKAIIQENAMRLIDVVPANPEDDLRHATDLIIEVRGGQIAVRMRRPDKGKHYYDLTIRADRPSGAETELSKISKGFARWYLYAWTDEGDTVESWMLVDLDMVRRLGMLNKPRPLIRNKDGTQFIAIHFEELLANGALVSHRMPADKIRQRKRQARYNLLRALGLPLPQQPPLWFSPSLVPEEPPWFRDFPA